MEATASLIFTTTIVLDVSDLLARTTVRAFHLCTLYGPSGIPVFMFGNRTTWRIQAQILGQVKEKDAMAFKKSILDECTMIAVAAAIIAQIAITALSLESLSQTHWVARGAFVLSLTSSLLAVYYATTQQRILGRLLEAKQVRCWIRGRDPGVDTVRLVPSLVQIVQRLRNKFGRQSLVQEQSQTGVQTGLEARLRRIEEARSHELRESSSEETHYTFIDVVAQYILLYTPGRFYAARGPFESPLCDPDDFSPDRRDLRNLKEAIIHKCFMPDVSSVITVSAPQILLSTSLFSLLIGFGVYFGFLWTRSLDQSAGPQDSRNVFITYITGLVVSGIVYSISRFFQDDDKRTERTIMEEYVKEYVKNNPEIVSNWGVTAEIVEGVLYLHSAEAEGSPGTTSEAEQDSQGNESLDSTGI